MLRLASGKAMPGGPIRQLTPSRDSKARGRREHRGSAWTTQGEVKYFRDCRQVSVDYKKFKLFELSILWRAGFEKRTWGRDVDLGPFQEELREHLLNDRDLAECQSSARGERQPARRNRLHLSPPPKEKGFEVNFGGFQGEYVRALRCSWAHEFCCTHVVLT